MLASRSSRFGIAVGWTAYMLVLQFLAHASISRVASGHLFLFALPFDSPASPFEWADAVDTARVFMLPAMVGACIIAVVAGWVAFRLFFNSQMSVSAQLSAFFGANRFVVAVFALATLLDLATTLWFFHEYGVTEEFHPGVRLMGYAYGRSVGPILGKGFQFVALLGLATVLGRVGVFLLYLAATSYLAGALYNASMMPW